MVLGVEELGCLGTTLKSAEGGGVAMEAVSEKVCVEGSEPVTEVLIVC